MTNKDEYFMSLALKEAKKAYDIDEVPVGCVIVLNDKVIARAYNKREKDKSSIFHAEILAIKKASKKLDSGRLDDCNIYVTLEPCIMCAGAILQAKIKNLYYGAKELRYGSISLANIFSYKYNYDISVLGGILEEESSMLISSFFKKLRN